MNVPPVLLLHDNTNVKVVVLAEWLSNRLVSSRVGTSGGVEYFLPFPPFSLFFWAPRSLSLSLMERETQSSDVTPTIPSLLKPNGK